MRRADATTAEVVRVLRVVTPAARAAGVTAVRARWQPASATQSGPVVVATQRES